MMNSSLPQPDTTLHQQMQRVKTLMETWGISKATLAVAVGIPPTALSNKFSASQAITLGIPPTSRNRFTIEEAQRIHQYLQDMSQDLQNNSSLTF